LKIGRSEPELALVQIEPPLAASSEPLRMDLIQVPEFQPGAALHEEPLPIVEDVVRELDLVGQHPSFVRMLDLGRDIARHSIPVLITGERGSGKTTVARFVARMSPRRREPFVVFDPVGLPDLLAAASLFGNTPNASRGAGAPGKGRLSVAGRGTVVIENVDSLPRTLQERLVRYIDTQLFTPVGEDTEISGEARLICTSSDTSHGGGPKLIPALAEKLKLGRLHLPSLHERASDIPLIVLHYLRRINESLKEPRSVSHKTLEALQYLNWPENVADLRMAIERSALFAKESELTLRDIRSEGTTPSGERTPPLPELTEDFSLETYLSELRKRLILRALELSKGNQSEAARLLRITPQAVHQFLKLHTRRR